MSTLKPSPIALVVCDNVYHESRGKRALVGLFNQISAREVPVVHPRLCVYASVTDIRPGAKLRLDIVHSEVDEGEGVIVSMEGPPPSGTEPTTICDLNFELNNVKFPEPGRYYIRFWGNEHLLLQRPFEVVQSGKKESS